MRTYCNYMQDDWLSWLLITKFADNNALSSITELTSFFINKDFHFRISFDFDFTFYASTRERLQTAKVKNITEIMKNILKYVIDKFKIAKKVMIKQVNKHRKNVSYQMFLFNKNIKTVKLFSKLKDKMLSSFEIKKIIKISY